MDSLYFLELVIHILISLAVLLLYSYQFLLDRRLAALGSHAHRVGKIQYYFHRAGVVGGVFFCVKSIDPVGAFGILPELFLSWVNQFVGALCLVAFFIMVFWTVDGAYTAVGLTQRIPLPAKIFFWVFAAGVFLVANVTILVRLSSKNSLATYGACSLAFAIFEAVSIGLLLAATFQLKRAISQSTLSSNTPQIAMAMKRLVRWIVLMTLVFAVCLYAQLSEFAELVDHPYKVKYEVDSDSYEFSDINQFWIAEYLGSFVALWYSWMPNRLLKEEDELSPRETTGSGSKPKSPPASPRYKPTHQRAETGSALSFQLESVNSTELLAQRNSTQSVTGTDDSSIPSLPPPLPLPPTSATTESVTNI